MDVAPLEAAVDVASALSASKAAEKARLPARACDTLKPRDLQTVHNIVCILYDCASINMYQYVSICINDDKFTYRDAEKLKCINMFQTDSKKNAARIVHK